MDNTGGRLAGFRVVVLESDFGLANGIQVGVDHDNAKNRILIVRAVQLKVCSRTVLPVDENLASALLVLSGRVPPPDNLLIASSNQFEIPKISINYSQSLTFVLI